MKQMSIKTIIGEVQIENKQYILVEWNDSSTTYVTLSFLIEEYPFLLLETLTND